MSITKKFLAKSIQGKQSVMLRNISIWLDTYDDIFSDFDPRPYSERVLSDDFLTEVRKVCKEKEEPIHELKLLIPAHKRNADDEVIITKRLHNQFKKNDQLYEKQYIQVFRKGVLFTLLGMLLMLAASYLSSLRSAVFHINVLLVISEPSGWFLVWSGLDTIFYTSKQHKKEFDFYSKLSRSKIAFFSI